MVTEPLCCSPSHICLEQAPYNCLLRQSRLKVWIFKHWPNQTAKLSDLLVRFYMNISVDGNAFPKKWVEFWNQCKLSDVDWFPGHWNSPITIPFTGNLFVSSVTESVNEER